MPKYPRERFVELAESRVNRVMNEFRLIGNLSDTSNYVYTQGQVDRMINALQEEIDNVEVLFSNDGDGEKELFTLDDGLVNQ